MTANTQEIITAVQTWANAVTNTIDIESIHLFGSLVYAQGARFDSKVSDVDLLLILGDDSDRNPNTRVKTLRALLPHKEDLERLLLRLLKRRGDEPISSFVVVSRWELKAAIHKDNSFTFYCDSDFLNLATLKKAPAGQRMSELVATSGALAATQGAQKFRNMYFAVCANGTRQPPPYSEGLRFPKDLLRAAAQLSFAQAPEITKESKFDTNKGLLYLVGLIGQNHSHLHDDLASRIGGRGTPTTNEWEVLQEYWEALAQSAAAVFKRPSQKLKDKFVEQAILSNTFLRIDPWGDAASDEEHTFKQRLKMALPISNRLFDAGEYENVTQCWAPFLSDPRFDPLHLDWMGKPFFILAIQGALIDLSYAHMRLLNGEYEKDDTANNLKSIFHTAGLVLSCAPYALSGPSDSTLGVEEALYGNGCYSTYLKNLDKFFEAWPPQAAHIFGVDISKAEDIKLKAFSRKFEVEFIMRDHGNLQT